MTSGTITYTLPELRTLLTNSFDVAPEFKSELTCLEQCKGKAPRYWLPYRVCYLDRLSLDPEIKSLNERKKVNLSSLCDKRTSLIRPIVKGLLEGHSGIPYFRWIESALDWIDRQDRSEELYTLDGTRRLYRDYTEHLRHRLRLSNVGDVNQSIGYPMAHALQSALAYLLAKASGNDAKVVQSWAILIPQRKGGLNDLPAPATTADEHALAYALHQRFFEAFSQAVLNNTVPPVVVKLEDLGFEDLIFYSNLGNNAGGWSTHKKGGRTDWKPFFYRRDGAFHGNYKEFNAQLAEHNILSITSGSFAQLQRKNSHFSQRSIRELANHATRHFAYLLLAETGSNAAHLASINCERVRLDRAIGQATTRAIKGRANFEQQEQHVDLSFAQTTWRQYLKLRDWMRQQLETPPELGLFLLSAQSHPSAYYFLSSASMQQLSLWPANAPSLATRSARKHKTVNLLEGARGNTALVAGLQHATISTIERHYSFKNREEAAKVMSNYFAEQAKAAEVRYTGIKTVRITESGEKTLAGICDSNEDAPKLIEGLERFAIEPRCGAPITCIFCSHFGIHAEIEDILRLLTIKLWAEVQSRLTSNNIDEHFQKFAPYINRIQQILDQLSVISGDLSKFMKLATDRFERGERDQYWGAKINALLEMEEA